MDVGYNLKSIKIIKTYLSQVDVEREIKIRMESSEGKLMFERKDECCLGSRSKCNFFGGGCKFKTNSNSQNV